MQLTKAQLKKLNRLAKEHARQEQKSYLEVLERIVQTYENVHVSDTGEILIRWKNGNHVALPNALK